MTIFLKAKLADSTIHPGMQRRAAIALRKPEGTQQTAEDRGAEAEPATDDSSAISKLSASWKACSIEQRRDFSIGSAVTAFAGRCPKNSRQNFRECHERRHDRRRL